MRGFIDGYDWCGKSDDELNEVKRQAVTFGSWRAFDANYSDEYFSVFLPLLQKFMDENADLFAVKERKRGASVRLVWEDDDASA